MIYINNEEKIKRISFEKDKFYVVADFDKTITAGTSMPTFGVLAKSGQVNEEYTKKRTELYQYYRPIEIDSTISDEEKSKYMDEWWKKHINLFYQYELKEEAIKKSIATGGLEYRVGAKKFLRKMNELEIPVIIISAGLGNIIEEFLKEENDDFENIKIISNFLEFENGVIKQMKDEPIHALNKNIVKLDDESKKVLRNRKNILLLGDGLADLKMISEEEKEYAITVGFLDEKIEENLEYYNQNFDIVLSNQGTFDDVNKILKIY